VFRAPLELVEGGVFRAPSNFCGRRRFAFELLRRRVFVRFELWRAAVFRAPSNFEAAWVSCAFEFLRAAVFCAFETFDGAVVSPFQTFEVPWFDAPRTFGGGVVSCASNYWRVVSCAFELFEGGRGFMRLR